jgi:hypothetical protein
MVAQLTGGASAMPEASGKDFKEGRVGGRDCKYDLSVSARNKYFSVQKKF